MENTLFQRVESKLREAERARLMQVPVGTISDRVGDLIHKAEAAGFIFKGPFATIISLPHLITYAQGGAAYSDWKFSVEVRCWRDGEVNLIILDGPAQVYWARVYGDGRVVQEFYVNKLPNMEINVEKIVIDKEKWWRRTMFTEELLTKAEKFVLAKSPGGIADLVSEVYILTRSGNWVCRPYMVKDPVRSQENAVVVKRLLKSLTEYRLLCGVVQVSSGWMMGRRLTVAPEKQLGSKEVLLFRGRGAHGTRTRVYELGKVSGVNKVVKFIGALEKL